MYESLTAFLEKLDTADHGEWIVDRENDGSPEHLMQLPFVSYRRAEREFVSTVYSFVGRHEEMGLNGYREILKDAGIEWGTGPMKNAGVSALDGRTVLALIMGAIRADRFCEGALLEFFENGCITKWLSRLKEIDSEA